MEPGARYRRNTMPTPAQMSLIIFFLCIVMFVTEAFPMATTAMLGCILMVVSGVSTFPVVFGQFASSSVILVISMMIVGRAMFETGAAQVVARQLVRFSKGSERRLLFFSMVLCMLISAFMSNVATLAMFMSILSNLSCGNRRMDVRNLMLPVAMGSVVGGVCTLIGSAPQITAQGVMEETLGQGVAFFEYAKMGSILCVALLIYVCLVGYPLGKWIWRDRPAHCGEEAEAAELPETADGRKMMVCMAVFAVMGVLFFLEPVPIAVVGAGAAVLCIMTGCVSQKSAICGISWSSVGKLAGCLGIMQAVNKSGGGQLIADAFCKVIGCSLAPHLLFAVMVLLTLFLSEFLTNSTALLITLPIALNICPQMGLNGYSFAIGITLASSMALATPLSCTPMTMVMSAGYQFKDFAKYALPFDLMACALIILLVPVFYPLAG